MKFKNFLKNIVSNVEKSLKVNEEVVKEEPPACTVKPKEPITGAPAPVVLSDDPWFAKPVKSEKQLIHEEMIKVEQKKEEQSKPPTKEPENIHELMYQKATKNQNTTVQLNPPGGSENFQEGGWNSGTGMGQFR